MGNQQAKKGDNLPLTPEKLKLLESSFLACGATSGKLPREKLLESWSNIIDPHLAQCTTNLVFGKIDPFEPSVSLEKYAKPYCIVESGTFDEKAKLLAASLQQDDSNLYMITELDHYVSAVLKSYLQIESRQGTEVFESWNHHGMKSANDSICAFSKSLILSICQGQNHDFTCLQLEQWLQINPSFLIIWREVINYLYIACSIKSAKSSCIINANVLPLLDDLPTAKHYTPILDIPQVIFVNSNLPNEYRNKWRFLFSSKIMGQSFSTLLGKIVDQGPTLLVVEDEHGYVFAGFAPEPWALKSHFFGNESSQLYTLSPAMRCFNSTGYNDHYQYLNTNQQTLPNGLGIGGQFNYWALWIDSDYGIGQSSESCTTFRDYVQLSKIKDFKIHNLEVYGIGDKPKVDDSDDCEDGAKNSILDKNLEDKIMLQLAGKELHSEGVREPQMDL